MNKRRAANRARSRGDVGGSYLEHREPSHREKGHKDDNRASSSSGSPAHVGETKGMGPVAGAGELDAIGPGKAGRRISGSSDADFPSRQTPSGSPPKGMKTQQAED